MSESGTLLVYALMSGEPVTIAPLDLIANAATYRLTAFREAVAHVQRGAR
jgi:hypothetical protein